MITPTHRLKKPIKYNGNDKPDDYHVIEERSWLGSGVIDKNGVEIFEGDFVKVVFDICDELDSPAIITFDKGAFWINPEGKYITRVIRSSIRCTQALKLSGTSLQGMLNHEKKKTNHNHAVARTRQARQNSRRRNRY